MVVTCPGCRSWFIVCAVHRDADGRDLHCLNCGSHWPAPATAGSFEPTTGVPAGIASHDPAVREAVAAIRDAVSSLCAQAQAADRPQGRASQLRSRDPAAIPA